MPAPLYLDKMEERIEEAYLERQRLFKRIEEDKMGMSKCEGLKCSKVLICKRATMPSNPYHQSYFQPDKVGEECEYFIKDEHDTSKQTKKGYIQDTKK